MSDKAILDGKKVVPVDDLFEWANWLETNHHALQVDYTVVGCVTVSTMFLGLNRSFMGGKPMWFETKIFGGEHDGYQELYETWEKAERGHLRALHVAGLVH